MNFDVTFEQFHLRRTTREFAEAEGWPLRCDLWEEQQKRGHTPRCARGETNLDAHWVEALVATERRKECPMEYHSRQLEIIGMPCLNHGQASR